MSALARFNPFDHGAGQAKPGVLDAGTGGLPRPLDHARRTIRLLFAAGPRAGSAKVGRPAPAEEPSVRVGSLARKRGSRLMVRSGLMALTAAGLATAGLAAATGLVASRPASADAPAAPGPIWTEIHHPLALYALTGTDFSKLPGVLRARRREPDGAREDVMTFGRLGNAGAFLQVSLLRLGQKLPGGSQEEDGLADGLARLAGAENRTATRFRPAEPMDTRLGRFETADLLLWDGGNSTACLGFRGGGAVLRVSGFACGAPGHPMGRAALACAIDRIDLVSAGDDAALRAFFVAAERRGGGSCLGERSLAAVSRVGRSAGWLDPGADMPPLRGLFSVVNRQR